MSIYYVSQQRGSDGNNGTSQATPKLTLAGVIALTLAGNDIIYVGPGTYAEQLKANQSGTAGNPITWQADPECRYLTSDKPGRVRVTSLITNVPTATSPCDFVTGGIRSYHTVNDFIFNGADGATITIKATGSTGDVFNRCVAFGGINGGNGGTYYDCLLIGTTRGGSGITSYRCVLYGGNYGAYQGSHYASIAHGQFGFSDCTDVRNCIAMGCYYGYSASTVYNSIAMSCQYGFYGTNTLVPTNCCAISCTNGFYGTSNTLLLVLTSNYYYGCNSNSRGGGYDTGSLNATTAICADYNWYLAYKQMKFFDAMGLMNLGNANYATTDFWGRTLPQGNGTVDIGHEENPNKTVSYTAGDFETLSPGIKIPAKGRVFLSVAVKGGKTVSISCRSKYTGTITSRPSLVLQGKTITTQTDTAEASAGTWETLSVSATPAVDSTLDVILSSNDTATTFAFFSDISVGIA